MEIITTNKLYRRFLDNMDPYLDKIIILNGFSSDILKRSDIINTKFDFIYIDGSHYACNVLEDAILSFSLLKSDGILIFDDYEWKNPVENTGEIDSPKLGTDAFLMCYKNKYVLLHKAYQVIIKKNI